MARKPASVIEEVPEVGAEIELSRELSKPVGLSTRQSRVADVTSLSELRAILGVKERDWTEIEPSFDVVDKATFEDIAIVVGGFRFNESKKFLKADYENPDVKVPAVFVSLLVAGYDPESEMFTTPWCIVNDGGSGICGQVERYLARYDGDASLAPPFTSKKGLRKSEYPYEDSDGNVSTATTWYIG